MHPYYEITPLSMRACTCLCVCAAALQNTNGGRSLHGHDNKVCHVHKVWYTTAMQSHQCVCVCGGAYTVSVCVVFLLPYTRCWIDTFTGHHIIDEMGMSVCVVFTNTRSWVRIDGEGAWAALCAPKPRELCRVHDDSLPLSLSLCQSIPPSLAHFGDSWQV